MLSLVKEDKYYQASFLSSEIGFEAYQSTYMSAYNLLGVS